MYRTETVFIEEDLQPVIKLEPPADFEASVDGGEPQEKIGEIFRVKADKFCFACTHCGAKFALYVQFVAHIDVHFQQFQLHSVPIDRNKPEESADYADVKPPVLAVASVFVEDDTEHSPVAWSDAAETSIKTEVEAVSHLSSNNSTTNPSSAASNANYCALCDKSFMSSGGMRIHKQVHASKMEAACPICDRKFAIQRYVYVHLRSKHNTPDAYRCDKCEAKFQFVQDLCEHQQTHRASSPVLERHYECHQCHQTFDTLPQCYNHMDDAHWKSRTFECKTCKTWYKSKVTLRKHLKLRICNVDAQSQLRCDVCSTVFRYKREMRKHRRVEHATARRTYKCSICDEEFTDTYQKKYHMIRHRKQERIANNDLLKCPFDNCSKEFSGRTGLTSHIKTHKEDAKFECELCHKTLRLSTQKNHMLRHENKKSHQCEECGMLFISSYWLNHHMISHSDVRTHQCTFCPKKFKTSCSLKIHTESHTGDYTYKCKTCSYGTSWRASLKKHSLAVHGKPLEDEPSVAHFSALTRKKK